MDRGAALCDWNLTFWTEGETCSLIWEARRDCVRPSALLDIRINAKKAKKQIDEQCHSGEMSAVNLRVAKKSRFD